MSQGLGHITHCSDTDIIFSQEFQWSVVSPIGHSTLFYKLRWTGSITPCKCLHLIMFRCLLGEGAVLAWKPNIFCRLKYLCC